ncbi:MAG: T9SS type A sorting domain-containing protein [Flavobacteriales bacterium]|nr:T9SS type A sorting domain-containing protein [Flavobacteriales bacterium]
MNYVFFDKFDPSISTEYQVTYCVQDDVATCAVSVEEETGVSVLGNITPNPVQDRATLNYELSSLESDAQLLIYNMVGEAMIQERIENRTGTLELSFANLPSGVYFYSIVNSGTPIATKKLVVSK